jgi:pimeloyl-ACP methyl ester carboxylesterase
VVHTAVGIKCRRCTGARDPGVLIVPGFGALDRNAVAAGGTPDGTADALSSSLNASSPGTVDPLNADLSQVLARAGIASFRYDTRGTASSRVRPDQPLCSDDEVADARAALDFMAQRRELGGGPLAVLGHDQGGVVAMRLAASTPGSRPWCWCRRRGGRWSTCWPTT